MTRSTYFSSVIAAVFSSDWCLLIVVLIVTFAAAILAWIMSVFCKCTGLVLCLYWLSAPAGIYSGGYHNISVLWIRSFGYFANGLLYRYGVVPGLRLFIDHVICSDTRSGLSRPSIVNLSGILSAKFIGGSAGSASAQNNRFAIGMSEPAPWLCENAEAYA